MRKISVCFWILAVLLSDAMCAVVAYAYCDMSWGIRCAGYSAPAWTAFLWAIPFAAGIAVCAVLAILFSRRYAQKSPSL